MDMDCECTHLLLDDCLSLKAFLPDGYDYKICGYEEKPSNQFTAVVRLPLSDREDVEKWFQMVQSKSCRPWRVDRTYKSNTVEGTRRKNDYRVDYRCQHNTKPRSKTADERPGSKNTSCPGSVYLVTKRCGDKRGRIRTSDPHTRAGYVTKCTIKNYHNHETKSVDALRRRDVSEGTKEKLIDRFKSRHSPTTALEALKYNLQEENEDAHSMISADRSICPDLHYFHRLYYSNFKRKYGARFQPLRAGIESVPAENEQEDNRLDVYHGDSTGNQISDSDVENTDLIQPDSASPSSSNLPQDAQIVRKDSLRAQPSLMRQNEQQRITSRATCRQDLRQKLHEMFTTLEHNLEANPEVFQMPIQSFTSSFSMLYNQSHLVSALHSFGKYSGVAPATQKICRKARRQGLQTSPQIMVQPTSPARRRMLLGGRRRLHECRPCKAKYSAERGYSKRKTTKS